MDQSSIHAQAIALQRIEIATPCTASWGEMKGDNRVRHCGDCNKSVFNLSAMPETEAAALLAGNTKGELCVRFYRRQDGTVMTSDCGTSQRAQVRQAWRKLPGMASLAFVALSAAGCGVAEAVPVKAKAKAKAPAPVTVVMQTVEVTQKKREAESMMTMGAPVPMQIITEQPAPKAVD